MEGLGLDLSRIALLYALGYEDQLKSEGLMPAGETSDQAREFFIRWLNQPAAADLPENLVGTVGKMNLLSSVLGCPLRLVVEDDDESIFLAERLLGAIEDLLATSLSENVFPYREDYVVRVERSSRVKGMPELAIDQEGGFSILRHNGNILTAIDTEQNWFLKTISLLTSQIVITPDEPDDYLHRIAYICNRVVPWHEGLNPEKAPESYDNLGMASGVPPKELYDRSSLKHSARKVSALINQALWNKAKWKAVAYVWSIDPEEPPYIALGFQNGNAGEALFRELIEKIGPDDKLNNLRISIITGLNKAFPN